MLMAQPLSTSPSGAVEPRKGPRILIVDDHEGTCEIITAILADEFDVVALKDGAAAWERILSDDAIMAVITDIFMLGLDGIELMRRIRRCDDARIQGLPVIAITGTDDKETRRRAFVGGATGFIGKPLDMTQLTALVHAYVHPDTAPKVNGTTSTPQTPAESVSDENGSPALGSSNEKILAEGHYPASAKPEIEATIPQSADPLDALSVADLEAIVQQEVSAQRCQSPNQHTLTTASHAAPLPAGLMSIDNALQLLARGENERLIPYLDQIRRQLEPLLKLCQEHNSKTSRDE